MVVKCGGEEYGFQSNDSSGESSKLRDYANRNC